MFDLEAAVGAAEPFRFTWGGKEFAIHRLIARSIDEQLALIDQIENLDLKNPDLKHVLTILRQIVGADLLAEINSVKPIPATGMVALVAAWMKFQEDDLGKSEASPASSARTARQSKPTSRSGRARKTS